MSVPGRRFVHIPALLALIAVGTASAGSGTVQFYKAKMAYEAERWKDAGRAFAAAGKAGYDAKQVHYWMARVYQKTGSRDRAKNHFLKARRAGMESNELAFELAKLYKDMDDWDNAAVELDGLPPAYTRQPEYQLIMGEIHTMQGDFEKAYPALKKALHRFPYKVHSLSGYLPELQQLALQDLAQKRMAEVEAEDARRRSQRDAQAQAQGKINPALPVNPKLTPQQPEEKKFLSPIGYFGSSHAFKKKTGMGKSYKLDRFGGGKKKGGPGGPLTLSRPSYGGSKSVAK